MKHKLIAILLVFTSFYSFAQSDTILLTERNFKLTKKTPAKFIYGIQKGDKILVTFNNVQGKKINLINIYQETESLYKKSGDINLDNLKLTASKTGFIFFEFSTKSKRDCFLKVLRIPSDNKGKYFNTAVQINKVYDTTFVDYEIDSVVGYAPVQKELKTFRVIKDVSYESRELYKTDKTLDGGQKFGFFVTKPQDTIKSANKEMVWLGYQVIITSKAGSQAMWDALAVGVDVGSLFLGPVAGIATGVAFDMVAPQEGGEPVEFRIMDNKENLDIFKKTGKGRAYEFGLVTGYSATWKKMDTLAIGLQNTNIEVDIKTGVLVSALYQVTTWGEVSSNLMTIKPETVRVKRKIKVIKNNKTWALQQ